MSTPSLLDKKLGMDIYTTKENGFKGFLKENPEFFASLFKVSYPEMFLTY